ncbi:hypothetical protein SKZ59_15115 [Janthinobacterium sp. GMG2]|uniref:hypothetical protein n=1 Tax=Janthinobacterium sp. GMG2 TaxID=3096606 RepID=UPI0029F543D2|nr:hypothetical protein [Janthinobacterium sp. GMG2]MDX8123111.1 hypothetical protein [Janthinobacterium sp. GMG2]
MTELSNHMFKVLALGKRLVSELDLEDAGDTLGCWMAHHIAAEIAAVEEAEPHELVDRFTSCRGAILELWRYRHVFPEGKRPFENLEPLLMLMRRIDPENPTPLYFRHERELLDKEQSNEVAKDWLSLAAGLDRAARPLLGYCLAMAAETMLPETEEWLKLITDLKDQDEPSIAFLRVLTRNISNSGMPLTSVDLDDSHNDYLKAKLENLSTFDALSRTLRTRLCEQQRGLSASKTDVTLPLESQFGALAASLDAFSAIVATIDFPNLDKDDLLELLAESRAELTKSKPNTMKLSSFLVAIKVGTNSISSLGAHLEALKFSANSSGISILQTIESGTD